MLKSQDSERNAKHNLRTGRTTDDDDEIEVDEGNEEQIVLSNNTRSHRSQVICKTDADNLQYEDPMVSELKQTEVGHLFDFHKEIVKNFIYFSVS